MSTDTVYIDQEGIVKLFDENSNVASYLHITEVEGGIKVEASLGCGVTMELARNRMYLDESD
jgi:hypothetical protein